jgi:cholinesterase
VIGAEDNCLTLNVYTRGVGGDGDGSSRDGGLLPIVVWIHGGGFSIGSGSDFFYGPYRAMDEPIVLVTINYRLGVLGFATGPGIPANLGLLDQRMAMTWIQANAIVFGGDPNNITLAGESAGAASVHFHMLSSKSRGLFHKAILQSGTALCPWASTTEINSISKLTSGTDELRRADAKDLIMMATKAPAPMGSVAFLPSPDDDFLPENPDILVRKWNEDMPIVVGINSNEGAFLAPALLASKTVSARLNDKTSGTLSELLSLPSSYYCEDRVRKAYFGQSKVIDWSTINLLSDAISDSFFTYPLYRLLRQILASSSPCSTRVFAYSYGHRGQFSFAQMMTGYEGEEDLGVSHFDEVLLQFNNKVVCICIKLVNSTIIICFHLDAASVTE